MRTVGEFLTNQTTRWNSAGKKRTKLRMNIYYTSLAIIHLDHSKDPYLAAAGLTVADKMFAGEDGPSKIPHLQAKMADF